MSKTLHYAVGIWKRRFRFENEPIFPASTLRPRNSKTQQSPIILDLHLSKTSAREITWLSWRHGFQSSVFKMFPVHTKTKTRRFQPLWCEERFRKAPFSWQISVDGRPNCRKKPPFSNSSGVMWAVPKFFIIPFGRIWFKSIDFNPEGRSH